MSEFKIGAVLDNAWELSKKHGIWMCLMLLVIHIINNALQSALCMGDTTALVAATQSGNTEQIIRAFGTLYDGSGPAIFLCEIIALCLTAGFLNTAILLTSGKLEKVNLSGFKMPAMVYVKYVLASLLLAAITGIGCVFCIIPGIWLLVRLLFANVAIVANPELQFFDAFRLSWEITKGHFWTLLGLGIVLTLLNIVGICCCCVGLLFTATVSEFALVVAYIVLTRNDDPVPVAD